MKPPRYIVDEDGHRIEVVLDVETYEQLLDAYEEIIDIEEVVKAEEDMKRTGEQTVPWKQVKAELGWSDLPDEGEAKAAFRPPSRKASA